MGCDRLAKLTLCRPPESCHLKTPNRRTWPRVRTDHRLRSNLSQAPQPVARRRGSRAVRSTVSDGLPSLPASVPIPKEMGNRGNGGNGATGQRRHWELQTAKHDPGSSAQVDGSIHGSAPDDPARKRNPQSDSMTTSDDWSGEVYGQLVLSRHDPQAHPLHDVSTTVIRW